MLSLRSMYSTESVIMLSSLLIDDTMAFTNEPIKNTNTSITPATQASSDALNVFQKFIAIIF